MISTFWHVCVNSKLSFKVEIRDKSSVYQVFLQPRSFLNKIGNAFPTFHMSGVVFLSLEYYFPAENVFGRSLTMLG